MTEQEHIGSVAMGDIGAIEEAKSIAADINSLLPGEMRQMTFWHNAALKMAAALSRPVQEPVAMKPLEWIGNEARSSLGDLYSVQQLSPNVWTTYMNGTAFPGWKAVRSSAMALAQENDSRRASPQPAHGTSATERVVDVDHCPICAELFKPDELCATDIEMGTCHAQCLEGSPVVDLDTGEETGGKIDTYLYSEVMDPPAPAPNYKPLLTATEEAAPAPNAVTAGQGVEVKRLSWDGCVTRSDLGDMYSIAGLSDNVWVTYWNGTAFPGWKSTSAEAKAAAQADYERRILSAIAASEVSTDDH